MPGKPTYKELEQRVKELEKKVVEYRQKKEALLESEEIFSRFLEHCPIYVFFKDKNIRSLRLSRNYEQLLGRPTDELLGKTMDVLFPSDLAQSMLADDLRILNEGKPSTVEEELNGRFYETTKFPILINGKPKYLAGYTIDITERRQAEEALKEERDRSQQYLDIAGVMFVAIDAKQNVTMVNRKGCEILGYEEHEIVGKNWFDHFIKTEDIEEIKGVFNQIISGNIDPVEHFENSVLLKEGDERIIAWHNSIIRDESERITGTLSSGDDITGRKQAEEALRESEEKYRAILENIEEGYYEVDLTGNFTFFNESMCKIRGYSREELMGMNNRDFMAPETAKEVYEAFLRVYNTGEPLKRMEWESIRGDGQKIYVETSASLIKDAEGEPIGFRGVVRDITDKRQVEIQLKQAKDFLQNILDSSIDGITTANLRGEVMFSSTKSKDILGHKADALIGKKAYDYYENGRDDAKKIMAALTKTGELENHELKFIHKDGHYVDVSMSVSYLRDEKGEIIGTLGIYRDITDKKRLEEQFQHAQRMESMGTLAGGIAHDFNNLLMGIQGNASLMLLDKASGHPDYEKLKNIEQYVQNGAALTKQLLGFARGGKYEVKPTNLNDIIKKNSQMFGRTKKEIKIHRKLKKDIWTVNVDQGQIEQVLLNLYVNAWQAMPGGGELYLETENVIFDEDYAKPYQIEPGKYVKISITDVGVGMDEAIRLRIFEPFFTTKEIGRGTGLGLASVYGIIKNHGGFINVYSETGKGTTFNIYLPTSEKNVAEEERLSADILRGTETVLLVDDEEMIIGVGEQLLETVGYKVLIAQSGQEALGIYKAKKDQIDLVILDMIMPGMGGSETYDRLKELNPEVKVLLSSGYSISGRAQEILDRGCNGFIQKPFNIKEISLKIRETLDSG